MHFSEDGAGSQGYCLLTSPWEEHSDSRDVTLLSKRGRKKQGMSLVPKQEAWEARNRKNWASGQEGSMGRGLILCEIGVETQSCQPACGKQTWEPEKVKDIFNFIVSLTPVIARAIHSRVRPGIKPKPKPTRITPQFVRRTPHGPL